MSSDMFSSLTENNTQLQDKDIFSFHELEYRQWEAYSDKCLIRRYTLCLINNYPCKKDKCFAWQIAEFIRFGKL